MSVKSFNDLKYIKIFTKDPIFTKNILSYMYGYNHDFYDNIVSCYDGVAEQVKIKANLKADLKYEDLSILSLSFLDFLSDKKAKQQPKDLCLKFDSFYQIDHTNNSDIIIVFAFFKDLFKNNYNYLKKNFDINSVVDLEYFAANEYIKSENDLYNLQLKNNHAMLGKVLRMAPTYIFKASKIIYMSYTDHYMKLNIDLDSFLQFDIDFKCNKKNFVNMFFYNKLKLHLSPYKNLVLKLNTKNHMNFLKMIRSARVDQNIYLLETAGSNYSSAQKYQLRKMDFKFHCETNDKIIDLDKLYKIYLDKNFIYPYYV